MQPSKLFCMFLQAATRRCYLEKLFLKFYCSGLSAVRENLKNLENNTFFQKVRENLEKSGKKNMKIMKNSGKSQEIYSVISLLLICLNLTYTYTFFINIYWYH